MKRKLSFLFLSALTIPFLMVSCSDDKEEQEVKLNFKPLTESEKIFIRQALVNINNQELQKKLAHFRKVCLQRKKALLIENNDMKCKYCGAALIEKNDL